MAFGVVRKSTVNRKFDPSTTKTTKTFNYLYLSDGIAKIFGRQKLKSLVQ